MMFRLFLTAIVLLSSLPAEARDERYRVPEYSGPSARFENSWDVDRAARRDQTLMNRQEQRMQVINRDDRSVDGRFQQRTMQSRQEAERRRNEVRRPVFNE